MKFEQPPTPEEGSEAKVEKYREMIGDSKAIFVLAMSDREVGTHGAHRPDSYSNIDTKGFMGGGHANVIAAAEIAQYFPEIKIVTTSYDQKGKPTLAETYAQELKRLGVSEERIGLEEKSTNTLTELFEMVKLAKKHDWASVSVLTNENHIERVQAMLDHLEELAKKSKVGDKEFFESWDHFEKGKKLQIHLSSSEEVLPLRDSRYTKIIEAMRSSDAYKKRVEAEKRGVQQIKDGTYGKK